MQSISRSSVEEGQHPWARSSVVSNPPIPEEAHPVVLVVGTGCAGLQTLRALLRAGIRAYAIEETGTVGGVWQTNYQSYQLQVPWHLYQFAEFPYPPALRPHTPYASGREVHHYMQAYAAHFGLLPHIRFHSRLERLERDPVTGVWAALVADTSSHGLVELHASFVVLATGAFSEPNIPPYKGQSVFSGLQVHSRNFVDATVATGKRLLIVGGGKSALDCATQVTMAAQVKKVTVITRRNRWPFPRRVGCLSAELLYARATCAMLPPYYTAGPVRRCMAALAQPVKSLFWRTMESKVRQAFKYVQKWTPPEAPLMQDLLHDGQIVDDSWTLLHNDRRMEHVYGDISHFTSSGVVLTDGRVLECDVVLYCTGYTRTYEFLDPDLRAKLAPAPDGLWLYRNMLPPGLPGLAFVGCEVNTLANITTHALQAEWLLGLLLGRVALPSPQAQEADIDAQRAWKAGVMPAQLQNRSAALTLYMQDYHDQLLTDLGLPRARKAAGGSGGKGSSLLGALGLGCLSPTECFRPYTAMDYTGLYACQQLPLVRQGTSGICSAEEGEGEGGKAGSGNNSFAQRTTWMPKHIWKWKRQHKAMPLPLVSTASWDALFPGEGPTEGLQSGSLGPLLSSLRRENSISTSASVPHSPLQSTSGHYHQGPGSPLPRRPASDMAPRAGPKAETAGSAGGSASGISNLVFTDPRAKQMRARGASLDMPRQAVASGGNLPRLQGSCDGGFGACGGVPVGAARTGRGVSTSASQVPELAGLRHSQHRGLLPGEGSGARGPRANSQNGGVAAFGLVPRATSFRTLQRQLQEAQLARAMQDGAPGAAGAGVGAPAAAAAAGASCSPSLEVFASGAARVSSSAGGFASAAGKPFASGAGTSSMSHEQASGAAISHVVSSTVDLCDLLMANHMGTNQDMEATRTSASMCGTGAVGQSDYQFHLTDSFYLDSARATPTSPGVAACDAQTLDASPTLRAGLAARVQLRQRLQQSPQQPSLLSPQQQQQPAKDSGGNHTTAMSVTLALPDPIDAVRVEEGGGAPQPQRPRSILTLAPLAPISLHAAGLHEHVDEDGRSSMPALKSNSGNASARTASPATPATGLFAGTADGVFTSVVQRRVVRRSKPSFICISKQQALSKLHAQQSRPMQVFSVGDVGGGALGAPGSPGGVSAQDSHLHMQSSITGQTSCSKNLSSNMSSRLSVDHHPGAPPAHQGDIPASCHYPGLPPEAFQSAMGGPPSTCSSQAQRLSLQGQQGQGSAQQHQLLEPCSKLNPELEHMPAFRRRLGGGSVEDAFRRSEDAQLREALRTGYASGVSRMSAHDDVPGRTVKNCTVSYLNDMLAQGTFAAPARAAAKKAAAKSKAKEAAAMQAAAAASPPPPSRSMPHPSSPASHATAAAAAAVVEAQGGAVAGSIVSTPHSPILSQGSIERGDVRRMSGRLAAAERSRRSTLSSSGTGGLHSPPISGNTRALAGSPTLFLSSKQLQLPTSLEAALSDENNKEAVMAAAVTGSRRSSAHGPQQLRCMPQVLLGRGSTQSAADAARANLDHIVGETSEWIQQVLKERSSRPPQVPHAGSHAGLGHSASMAHAHAHAHAHSHAHAHGAGAAGGHGPSRVWSARSNPLAVSVSRGSPGPGSPTGPSLGPWSPAGSPGAAAAATGGLGQAGSAGTGHMGWHASVAAGAAAAAGSTGSVGVPPLMELAALYHHGYPDDNTNSDFEPSSSLHRLPTGSAIHPGSPGAASGLVEGV